MSVSANVSPTRRAAPGDSDAETEVPKDNHPFRLLKDQDTEMLPDLVNLHGLFWNFPSFLAPSVGAVPPTPAACCPGHEVMGMSGVRTHFNDRLHEEKLRHMPARCHANSLGFRRTCRGKL